MLIKATFQLRWPSFATLISLKRLVYLIGLSGPVDQGAGDRDALNWSGKE